MAHKLNLVKSRLISSHEDLMAFKREATAALLKFAESNDCDLDAISQLLTTRYAEINQALDDGYKVESEVEIYPQPAPPETSAVTFNVGDEVELLFGDGKPNIGVVGIKPEELNAAPGDVYVESLGAAGLVPSSKLRKVACMQRIADQLHPVQPAQLDDGRVDTQDPLDLLVQQQEREAAESMLSSEDIAKLIADAPDRQPIANDIVSSSSRLGHDVAWGLISRIAANRYSASELKEIAAALKVVAADEESDEAVPGKGDATAAAVETPADEVVADPAVSAAAETLFTDAGELKMANDLVAKFNEIMAEIDPSGYDLRPISIDEIVSKGDVLSRQEREVPENVVEPITPYSPENLILPAYNKLDPAEKAAVIEGVEVGDVPNALDQWYAEKGIDVIADMVAGVNEVLKAKGEQQITGQQIVDRYLADSEGKGHITTPDVDVVLGELRHESSPTYAKEQEAHLAKSLGKEVPDTSTAAGTDPRPGGSPIGLMNTPEARAAQKAEAEANKGLYPDLDALAEQQDAERAAELKAKWDKEDAAAAAKVKKP